MNRNEKSSITPANVGSLLLLLLLLLLKYYPKEKNMWNVYCGNKTEKMFQRDHNMSESQCWQICPYAFNLVNISEYA